MLDWIASIFESTTVLSAAAVPIGFNLKKSVKQKSRGEGTLLADQQPSFIPMILNQICNQQTEAVILSNQREVPQGGGGGEGVQIKH